MTCYSGYIFLHSLALNMAFTKVAYTPSVARESRKQYIVAYNRKNNTLYAIEKWEGLFAYSFNTDSWLKHPNQPSLGTINFIETPHSSPSTIDCDQDILYITDKSLKSLQII